jgi:DNA-binding CsgD family transcriptional regulator
MLKKNIILFLLLNNMVIFSQKNLSLDSFFTKEKVTPYLAYYQDISENETIETIQSKSFESFKNKNFPGLYKKKFWFKLKIANTTHEVFNLIFKIKAYAFYKDFKIYKVSNGVVSTVFNTSVTFKRKFDAIFKLDSKEKSSYYFEVQFSRAVFLPIQLTTVKENNKVFIKEIAYQGIYYGFTLLVLIINLLFFIYTKNKFFLYYIIFQIAIVGSIAFLDGIIYQLLGKGFLLKFINILFNIMLAGGGLFFLKKSLSLEKDFPLFKYITGIIFMFCICFFFIYMYTLNSFWEGLAKMCYLAILTINFLTAAYFIIKKVYARFFFLAFGVLFTCHILFILPVLYGLKDFGFTEWHYKIGSSIEMIIFLIAIPYRHQSLSNEKHSIEQELSSQKKQLIAKNIESVLTTQQKLENFSTKFNLTTREIEVLNCIIKGKNNKEIANVLFVTEATVKYHCSKLYDKTRVKNRSQLTALFNSNS